MEHSQYKAMAHAQEQARLDKISKAWSIVFDAMAKADWTPIPDETKKFLGLHPAIGGCSGTLVTRIGAKGMMEFITRMNNRRSITS